MTLVKTALLSGIATVVRIASALVVNKVIAVCAGPSGMALVGSLLNLLSFSNLAGTAGIGNGVIKYVAEYRESESDVRAILSTAARLTIGCSIALAAALIVLRRPLSEFLFQSDQFAGIVLTSGIALVPAALNTFLLAVLNGGKRIQTFFLANILASVVTAMAVTGVTHSAGLRGAMHALIISQIAALGTTLLLVKRDRWPAASAFKSAFDRVFGSRLAHYSFMTLVSALTVPAGQILVRNHLIDTVSLEAAGEWQGIWKISETYMLLVTATLSVYYLPRLAELNTPLELRHEILTCYSYLLPITVVSALAIYIFRDLIVRLLFTAEFAGMHNLFAVQLLGDVLKIASWILGYLTVAKAMTKVFVVCEIGFVATFVVFSMLLVNRFGLVGVTYAYALNYLLYLVVMVCIFYPLLRHGR